jgi:hypothetical protein
MMLGAAFLVVRLRSRHLVRDSKLAGDKLGACRAASACLRLALALMHRAV